ncbi:alpha-L-fucosidase [Tessaracoccus rhinocerotis]|uniref:alpha-L-fucosidase n=1 Tax=Tessaracoccus rhinocerotis TaxID=1689449 RepID=A0A553K0N9_9ACTN|nr:alpha-L-fucosidase [Tessaracoccus rhinocerotis]TRY18255.1 alpha-L-fucosidase [Tessaracoccus rhinocerotis]
MSTSRRIPAPHWATEASLGIFIHWGPYSVPAWAEPTGAWGAVEPEHWFAHNAYAEWYANTIRIPGSPAAAHHAATYGDAPYEHFLDTWDPVQFDPEAWAEVFAAAGADYVVPVTKHHDGVALWDAPGGTPSTVHRGPRRDLIGPIAEAVRARGMRFGVYYSGGLDWAHTNFPPIRSMADVDDLRPNDPSYAALATAHVRDLVDRYRPSVVWNDINWPDAGKRDGSLAELLAHFRRVVPDGLVNDRWGADVWDYRTSEYAHDAHHENGTGWEQTRGLGFSFGHNRMEDESLTLTPRGLAELWADIVSRGGRLLLNVGPEASGAIPEVQLRTLRGFGEWMRLVKPFTTSRGPAPANPEALGWERSWTSAGRLVTITADDSTPASLDGDRIVIPLPPA